MIEFSKLNKEKRVELGSQYTHLMVLIRLGNELDEELMLELFDGCSQRMKSYQWCRYISSSRNLMLFIKGMSAESIEAFLYNLNYSEHYKLKGIRNQ